MNNALKKAVSVISAVALVCSLFVCLTVPVSAETKVLLNESFENYTYADYTLSSVVNENGDTVKEKSNKNYFSSNMAISDEDVATGYRALKFTYDAQKDTNPTTAHFARLVNVQKSSRYIVSYKYKVGAKTDVAFYIDFLTASSTNIWLDSQRLTTSKKIIYPYDEGVGTWQEATVAFNPSGAVAGSTELFLNISLLTKGNAEVYIDDVKVTKVTTDETGIIAFGGERQDAQFITGAVGSSFTLTSPSKENYNFDGWYTDEECTEPFTGKTLTSGLTLLYPNFTVPTTINYHFGNLYYGIKGVDGCQEYQRSINTSVSNDVLYNGYPSLKIDNTDRGATDFSFFPLGDGITPDAYKKDRAYVATVKYKVVNAKGGYGDYSKMTLAYTFSNNVYGAQKSSTSAYIDCEEDSANWKEAAFPINLKGVERNNLAFFITINGVPGATIYIGEVVVEQLPEGHSAVAINSGLPGVPNYVSGAVGSSFTLNNPSSFDGAFTGYFTKGTTPVTYNGTEISSKTGGVEYPNGDGYCKMKNYIIAEQPYTITALTVKNYEVESFESYYYDLSKDVYTSYNGYDNDYELYDKREEGNLPSNVISGNISLHRTPTPYFANAILLNRNKQLGTGQRYTMTMNVKMDSYAQTKGAIKITSGANPYYPWATANAGGHTIVYDTYYAVASIASLTDGKWHRVQFTFDALTPYVILQTPGYCSLYFDSISFTRVGTSTPLSSSVSFSEYTQKVIENPTYTTAKTVSNLDFEEYEFADGNKKAFGDAYSITSDAVSGTSALKYDYKKDTVAYNTEKNMFRLADVKNGATYKVTFKYKASALSNKVTVNFATADKKDMAVNKALYKDAGNTFTIKTTDADNKWHTGTVYLSTSLAYTVKNDACTDDSESADITYGDMLYAYLTQASDSANTLILDNFTLTELNNVVASNGVAKLTDSAASATGNQAMRFYYIYGSANGQTCYLDGATYTVAERGIILNNAKNSSGKVNENGDFECETPSLTNGNYILKVSKNSLLSDCWSQTSSLTTFSTYIKGFKAEDTKNMRSRAYLVLSDKDGNKITLYSAVRDESIASLNEKATISSSTATKHTLMGKTLNNFKVIVPNSASYLVTSAADELCGYISSYTGTTNTRGTDYGVAYKNASYEIVVGATSRSVSSNVASMVENDPNAYVVYAVTEYKIAILGGSDLATRQGVLDLIETFKKYQALGKGYVMPKSTHYMGVYEASEDDYIYSFGDEFNGSDIDLTKWGDYDSRTYATTSVGGPSGVYKSQGGTNHTCGVCDRNMTFTTKSGQTLNPLSVSNGNLSLNTFLTNSGKDFISSSVSTFETMMYKYGILEFRVKLANTPAATSIWVNGGGLLNTGKAIEWNNIGGTGRTINMEVDLVESYGYANYFASNLHRWIRNEGVGSMTHNSFDYDCDYNKNRYPERELGSRTNANTLTSKMGLSSTLQNDFHIVSFVWTENGIKFALDGKVYLNYDFAENMATSVFKQYQYIICDTGMGSESYGVNYTNYANNASAKGNLPCLIDYVRLYQVPRTDSIIYKENPLLG